MTIRDHVILYSGALLIVAGAAFPLQSAAQACTTIAEVQAAVESNGGVFKRVPDAELPAFLESLAPVLGSVPVADAAVVAMIGETPVFGLEIDGCMTPPIQFPALM